MIPRYTLPEMGAIWSDTARFEAMLRVELAVARAQSARGQVPPDALAALVAMLASLRNEAGEYLLAVREGLIAGEDHVRAELGEVLAGLRPGRTSDEELTLFRSLGLAIEDLAAAELAVANARRQGLGTEVEL